MVAICRGLATGIDLSRNGRLILPVAWPDALIDYGLGPGNGDTGRFANDGKCAVASPYTCAKCRGLATGIGVGENRRPLLPVAWPVAMIETVNRG